MSLQRKRSFLATGLSILACSALALLGTFANSGSASSGNAPNGNAYGYIIHNNTPGFVEKAADRGSVDPNTLITITAWLKLPNENQLAQLAEQLYSKNSPNFHKWINQDQFNDSFSPSAQELNAVQNFLTAHGLSVLAAAENNFYVKVQGTVGQIEQTFHVQVDNFSWNGATYRSNTTDPAGNDPGMGLIAGITGMDDYGFEPALVQPAQPDGTPVPMIPPAPSPPTLLSQRH